MHHDTASDWQRREFYKRKRQQRITAFRENPRQIVADAQTIEEDA